jgi:hypothetical protein
MSMACMALSCGQLAAADSSGATNLQPGSGQFSPGTVGDKCKLVENGCQWLSNECSADPDCAPWYRCILSCKLDGAETICMDACKGAGELPADRAQLRNCLLSPASCTTTDMTAEEGGMGGAGGKGPTGDASNNSDAGVPGPGPYDPESGGAGTTGAQFEASVDDPTYTTCDGCAYNLCVAPVCPGSDVTGTCYDYKTKFVLKCFPDSSTQAQLETCMYTAEQTDPAVASGHVKWIEAQITSCVDLKCPNLCTPKEYRTCLDCQRALCASEYAEFLSSAEAQDYQWCRTRCNFGNAGKPLADAGACLTECETKYPDGFAIDSPLAACKFDKCAGEGVCSSLP